MSQGDFPAMQSGIPPVRPHRGSMILVFGILGIVLLPGAVFCIFFAPCVVFAILAWVMGSSDLKKMDAGQMDQSGRGLTQAGKVLGIIGVVLTVISFVILAAIIVIANVASQGSTGSWGP